MKYAKDLLKTTIITFLVFIILRGFYNFIYKLVGKKHILAILLICLPFILIKPALDVCLTKDQKNHIKEKKDTKKVFISPTITKENPNNPWGKSSFE
jgi:hypothetical protein